MSKPFKFLRNKMSASARKKAEAKAKKMIYEMPLQELKQASIDRKLQSRRS